MIPPLNREHIANKIIANLLEHKNELQQSFAQHQHGIPFFYIDNLLPDDWCTSINKAFPETSDMKKKKRSGI